MARYPHVDDYRRAIADLDEKQFINLRLTIMEVRNHYVSLIVVAMQTHINCAGDTARLDIEESREDQDTENKSCDGVDVLSRR